MLSVEEPSYFWLNHIAFILHVIIEWVGQEKMELFV